MDPSNIPTKDLESFKEHLGRSKRIVALLGAGLSASSGLPTFRGAGGFWRTHDATQLATPNAFRSDPGLVWQFYSYRRHMALNASPNRAHLALAELAKRNPDFITLSQNVDGLSPRAGHPASQLKLLHGNLFDVKCWDEYRCGYIKENDFTDPIVPVLAIPADRLAAEASLDKAKNKAQVSLTLEAAMAKKNATINGGAEPSTIHVSKDTSDDIKQQANISSQDKEILARKHPLIKGADIANIDIPIPTIKREDLPQCPQCNKNLLRPGVVWFGESLPENTMNEVHEWFDTPEKIDLMLVIGTSAKVYPAAGYTEIARKKGARVAVINMDKGDAQRLTKRDWFFEGDAAVIVPELLKSVIGEIGEFKDKKGGVSAVE